MHCMNPGSLRDQEENCKFRKQYSNWACIWIENFIFGIRGSSSGYWINNEKNITDIHLVPLLRIFNFISSLYNSLSCCGA
jgi:hypothetical protein